MFFTRASNRIGGKYKKALYIEYTDSTFSIKKPAPNHRGFLGPVIRAEVGDTIKVVFKNMVSVKIMIDDFDYDYDTIRYVL